MKHNNTCFLFFLILFFVLGTTAVKPENPKSFTRNMISSVSDFNSDGIPDTLFGSYIGNRLSKPSKIIWGHNDSVQNGATFSVLKFEYPDLSHLSSYFAVFNMNTNDTLNDITIYYYGRIYTDSTNYTETKKVVTIFGQPGLDTIETIKIDSIETFQTEPFIGIRLRIGNEITKSKRIDNQKRAFIVNKINLDINNPVKDSIVDYLPPKMATNRIISKDDFIIYPNPSSDYVIVENTSIDEDNIDVIIKISDVIGRVYKSFDTRFAKGEKITLNISELPPGSYLVQIQKGFSTNICYNLVITR